MFRRLTAILICLSLSAAAPAGLSEESLEALRGIDLRLATIAHRLVTRNVDLCRAPTPATGAVVHAITQYDRATQGAARKVFGFATPIAIEAVVAGSPAARAGLAANDGLTAVNETTLAATGEPPTSIDRDAALALIAKGGSPVRLALMRGGVRRSVTVAAAPGCPVAFEILLGPEMTAQSDGRVVQIGVRFFERYTDEEVAVVAAHELGHAILRHRVRLEAAGVKGGLFGEIGRNARLGQRAETEADRLGVTLLYNAGYDPASAADFWAKHGAEIDGGFFRSRTHPATKLRVAAIEAEASALMGNPTRPVIPALLATRDQPMK